MEEEKNEETNEETKANVTEKKFDFWYVIPITVLIVIVVIGVVFGIRFIKNGKEEKLPKTYNYTRNTTNNNSTNNNNNSFMFGPDEKPIIYIYPTERTDIEVKLGNPENLSCTYPNYENGWSVTANSDGSLIDKKTGRNLYALYWEGKNIFKDSNMEEGFCIKGEDTAKFLEEKLAILGLTDREAEEFIVYWLPKMEDNKYNYIRFETMEEQEKAMPLEVTPKPDNVIRIMMDWKALEENIEVDEQELITPSREGYTVVEWGGTELD